MEVLRKYVGSVVLVECFLPLRGSCDSDQYLTAQHS